jgi:flagellar hook-associated protein 3 FlgL
MSGIGGVYGPPEYGSLMQVLAGNAALRRRVDLLTEQSSNGGRKSDSYAGLGVGASISLDLRPQLAHAATWTANIAAASGRMQMAQTVLAQLTQIASSFAASLNTVTASGDIDTLAAQARDALKQVAGLLNTTNGGVYVFAGQESDTAPVPSGDAILSSPFFRTIQTAVEGLGPSQDAEATIAATRAVATSPATTPYSFAPAAAPQSPVVNIGNGQFVATGIVAGVNSDAVQTGSSTTGSYTTDLMRALATIGAMSSSQADLGSDFTGLIDDTRASLQGVVTAISTDSAMLGSRQNVLSDAGDQLTGATKALTSQVSGVEDVDMATLAVQLSQAQTQLQASYQVIAGMKQFSLVNYL